MRLAPLLGSLASFLASCAIFSPAGPSPYVQAATQPASMPLVPAALQPHEGPLPVTSVGSKGASNVGWLFAGAPTDGLDAVRATFTPTILENAPANYIYWAFNSWFINGADFYFGLQPNGQYGKTALFSVFGDGSNGMSPSCKAGADNGAGTSCHIPYAWQMGHSYQFMVRLARGDTSTLVYEGVIADLATGAVTVIGDIAVTAAHGLIKAEGVSFEEFYKAGATCPPIPHSEVLIQQVVGYRAGNAFAGAVHSLKANNGCTPAFYGDDRTYVYMNNGY